jgi:putative transposase
VLGGTPTRVGTIDVSIPKLRSGSDFLEWLLERRKRAEAAMVSVVATCYLLGVSTRRMDKLAQSLGITSLSKSQVFRMATDLEGQVEAFRTRTLTDAGPFMFVAADALTMKVREDGRMVNAVVLVATGVKVATSETKEAWNTFFADLVARGLAGVRLVTSDAHRGLVEAIAANLPGATWQRLRAPPAVAKRAGERTHHAANLMRTCPKSAWPAVKAMLHSVYDQPDPEAVHAQFTKMLDQLTGPLPEVADHLDSARSGRTTNA